jgi:hypothetical protein
MHPEVRLRAKELVADLQSEPCYRDVLAVVVSGSAARAEERWREGRLESDIDVMVIARSSSIRLDRTRAVERVIARHAARGIEGGRVPVGTLRYATLTNYEAGQAGVVVDGDTQVLGRVPLARPADIPTWEAVRLLANRLYEHLMQRAGQTGAESAVRKSYEAIGEAQLVLEGRYRPSFHERAGEIRRQPLDSPVPDASRRYLEAEGSRRAGEEMPGVELEVALDDLLTELAHAMRQHSGRPGDLGRQLEELAHSERHLSHRAYWAALGVLSRRDGMHAPTQDPIVRLWRAAVSSLTGRDVTPASPERLVGLWRGCPQILRPTRNMR